MGDTIVQFSRSLTLLQRRTRRPEVSMSGARRWHHSSQSTAPNL